MNRRNFKSASSVFLIFYILLISLFFYKSYSSSSDKITTITTNVSVNFDKDEIIKLLDNMYKNRCFIFITKDITNLTIGRFIYLHSMLK